jgi:hypothetical protein
MTKGPRTVLMNKWGLLCWQTSRPSYVIYCSNEIGFKVINVLINFLATQLVELTLHRKLNLPHFSAKHGGVQLSIEFAINKKKILQRRNKRLPNNTNVPATKLQSCNEIFLVALLTNFSKSLKDKYQHWQIYASPSVQSLSRKSSFILAFL